MNFTSLQANKAPSLNLTKGSLLDLSKSAPNLHHAILAGGWDMSQAGATADLDIAAFLLTGRKKIRGIEDVVYFNHKETNGIYLEEDNLTGEGDGDDEVIHIDLDNIDQNIEHIVFVITIFEAEKKHQTFGMIQNAYVRLLDEDRGEHEICHYNLTNDYQTSTAVKVCSLHRNGHGWEFEAQGEGIIGDLNTVCSMYF